MVTQAGRPERPRDPAAARQRILDAAAEEFARRGFAGARVDRIAAEAGTNKRMLYHYFGDKRGLQRAVHGARLGPGAEVRATARHRAQAARLRLWALLEDAPRHDEDGIPGPLAERLAEAQRLGRLAPGLDPGALARLLLWGEAALQVAAQPAEPMPSGLGTDLLNALLEALAPAGRRDGERSKPRIRLKPRQR